MCRGDGVGQYTRRAFTAFRAWKPRRFWLSIGVYLIRLYHALHDLIGELDLPVQTIDGEYPVGANSARP